MNDAARWLYKHWRMILGTLLAFALWVLIAVNSGQGGLGF